MHVIIGPLATFEALAIDDYMLQAKVPLITPTSAAQNDLAQQKKSDYVSTSTAPPRSRCTCSAITRRRSSATSASAMIADDFTYGHEGAAGFHRVFEDNGGKIVQKLWPALNAPDYGSFVGQMKTNVDGVYAGFAGSNPLRFLRAYKEFGLKMPVFGNPTWSTKASSRTWATRRSACIRRAGTRSITNTPDNKRFVEGDPARIQGDAGLLHRGHVHGGTVARRSAEDDQGQVRRQGRVRQGAAQREADHGPMGPMRLDEYGKPVLNIYIRKVERKDGQLVNTTVDTVREVTQFWTYDPKQFICGPAVRPRRAAGEESRVIKSVIG